MMMARTPSLNASSREVFILLRAGALRRTGDDSLREAGCPPKLQRRRASVLRVSCFALMRLAGLDGHCAKQNVLCVSYRESFCTRTFCTRRALRGNDHRSQTASPRTQSREIVSYHKV